jgi:hypothetical protein
LLATAWIFALIQLLVLVQVNNVDMLDKSGLAGEFLWAKLAFKIFLYLLLLLGYAVFGNIFMLIYSNACLISY